MAQVGNTQDRVGGEYMVQDTNHMGQTSQSKHKATRNSARQTEQSHAGDRQQGGTQRGGEGRRQSH